MLSLGISLFFLSFPILHLSLRPTICPFGTREVPPHATAYRTEFLLFLLSVSPTDSAPSSFSAAESASTTTTPSCLKQPVLAAMRALFCILVQMCIQFQLRVLSCEFSDGASLQVKSFLESYHLHTIVLGVEGRIGAPYSSVYWFGSLQKPTLLGILSACDAKQQ